MKILCLLIALTSIRTCTKESLTSEQKAATVTPLPIADSTIVTRVSLYFDDLKTRGVPSEERTKLSEPAELVRDFAERFAYPESARDAGIEGSCTVQFAIDQMSKIQYFSVLQTDSKLFSDEVRRAIFAQPVTLTPFPSGYHTVRFEVTVDYRLSSPAKM